MAARSRPRAGQLKDELDEERSLWSQIQEDAKRIDILMQSDTPPSSRRRYCSATSSFARPDEDWRQITDPLERRRIRKRIEKRAYHQRRKYAKQNDGPLPKPASYSCTATSPFAKPGEDWRKITDPVERKRIQSGISNRTRRARLEREKEGGKPPSKPSEKRSCPSEEISAQNLSYPRSPSSSPAILESGPLRTNSLTKMMAEAEIDPSSQNLTPLWLEIRRRAKPLQRLVDEQTTVSKKIIELNAQQSTRIDRGGLSERSASIDQELEKNLRENIRLGEKINDEGELLMDKMQILAALRDAQESGSMSASRSASVGKSQRDRHTKRKLTDVVDDRDSIAADSPGGHPSPKGMVPNKDRIKAMSGGSRAGSVPAGRESSVKAEEALESQDQLKVATEKHRLVKGTEVLYRNNKSRTSEGEGILCRVTDVIGEGKQRRYEIIDADPDPPTPAQPYRASVNHLVAIPPPQSNSILPDLKNGKQVLALYPGTTTFYKAEVVAPWTRKGDAKEQEGNLVRLRFEGEDEAERQMSVERRYVLPEK